MLFLNAGRKLQQASQTSLVASAVNTGVKNQRDVKQNPAGALVINQSGEAP